MDNTSKKRGRKPSRARDNAIDLDDEPFSNDHYVILFALWLLHIKFRALIAPPSPEVGSAPTHQLAIKLDGLTFDSLRTVKARIARLPPGPDRVDAWVEVVRQLNRRYRRGTDIDFDVISTIKADPSWGLCKWSVENVNKLVEPIQVHVIAVKNTRHRQTETIAIITRELGEAAGAYIASQYYSENILKHIVTIAL